MTDYAERLRELSDERYSNAEVIVLVQDNLNTYSPASLYDAFEPAEAQRLARRFGWHYPFLHPPGSPAFRHAPANPQ